MRGPVVAGEERDRPGPVELGEGGDEGVGGDHGGALEATPPGGPPQALPVAGVGALEASQRDGIAAAQAQRLVEVDAVGGWERRPVVAGRP